MKKRVHALPASLIAIAALASCVSLFNGYENQQGAQPSTRVPAGGAAAPARLAYSPKDGRGHRLVIYTLPLQIDRAATPDLAARFREDLTTALGDVGIFDFQDAKEEGGEAYPEERMYGSSYRDGWILDTWRAEIFRSKRPDFILSGGVAYESEGGGVATFIKITDGASGYPTFSSSHFTVSTSPVDFSDHVAYHARKIRKTRVFSDRVGMTNQNVMEILRVHSPDSYALLQGLARQGGNDILDFMTFSCSLASDVGTQIHEGSHFFSHWKDRNELFIDASETLLIPETPVFPSRRLSEIIPPALRTFRYDDYIESKMPNQTTQASGIYGLLDEMLAYYHGTRTAYEMYEYCRASADPDFLDPIQDYLTTVYGNYYAYYEFKFFILTYLQYARDKEPGVFRGILDNDRFRLALRTIDAKYAGLIAKIHERESYLTRQREGLEMTLKIEGDTSYIYDSKRNALCAANFRSTIATLEKEMTDPRYAGLLRTFFPGTAP